MNRGSLCSYFLLVTESLSLLKIQSISWNVIFVSIYLTSKYCFLHALIGYWNSVYPLNTYGRHSITQLRMRSRSAERLGTSGSLVNHVLCDKRERKLKASNKCDGWLSWLGSRLSRGGRGFCSSNVERLCCVFFYMKNNNEWTADKE